MIQQICCPHRQRNRGEQGEARNHHQRGTHNVHHALHAQKNPLVVAGDEEIRIQDGIAWPARTVSVPVVGKEVERERDLVESLQRHFLLQSGTHSAQDGAQYRTLVADNQSRKDNTDRVAVLVPADHIGFARGGLHGRDDAVQGFVGAVAVLRRAGFQQHQQEGLSGTFCALALNGDPPPERFLDKNVAFPVGGRIKDGVHHI